MSIRVNSINSSFIFQDALSKTQHNRVVDENAFYTNDIKPNIDKLDITSSSKPSEKKSEAITAGIAAGTILATIAAACIFKCKPKKALFTESKLNKALIEPNSVIAPQNFKVTNYKSNMPNFLNKYVDEVADVTKMATIKSSYKPKTLEILKGKHKTLDASNFSFPNGTIAIPSKLNETLSTSGLLQCAALAVVDKTQNLQTLIHCCPTVGGNESLLKYILSHSNSKNLDITLVPGYYKETDTTIDLLVKSIKKYAPDAKLTFANFPDNANNVLVLKNGILKCCKYDNVIVNTNPINRIVHA